MFNKGVRGHRGRGHPKSGACPLCEFSFCRNKRTKSAEIKRFQRIFGRSEIIGLGEYQTQAIYNLS